LAPAKLSTSLAGLLTGRLGGGAEGCTTRKTGVALVEGSLRTLPTSAVVLKGLLNALEMPPAGSSTLGSAPAEATMHRAAKAPSCEDALRRSLNSWCLASLVLPSGPASCWSSCRALARASGLRGLFGVPAPSPAWTGECSCRLGSSPSIGRGVSHCCGAIATFVSPVLHIRQTRCSFIIFHSLRIRVTCSSSSKSSRSWRGLLLL